VEWVLFPDIASENKNLVSLLLNATRKQIQLATLPVFLTVQNVMYIDTYVLLPLVTTSAVIQILSQVR